MGFLDETTGRMTDIVSRVMDYTDQKSQIMQCQSELRDLDRKKTQLWPRSAKPYWRKKTAIQRSPKRMPHKPHRLPRLNSSKRPFVNASKHYGVWTRQLGRRHCHAAAAAIR